MKFLNYEIQSFYKKRLFFKNRFEYIVYGVYKKQNIDFYSLYNYSTIERCIVFKSNDFKTAKNELKKLKKLNYKINIKRKK